jgi:plasmid maintenance system antidote protein VapI
MRIVHGTWKSKKANNLAACMGVSQRAAEHVLSGRNAPSSDALIGLLRSGEIGPQLLDALLGDLDWYQYRQNLQRLGEHEAAARAAIRDHEELKAKIGRTRR